MNDKAQKKPKRKNQMFIPTILMGVAAVIFFFIAYSKGPDVAATGLKISSKMFIEITPILVFAFILAGLVQVLIPQELLTKYIGAESGFKGIIIGSIAGAFAPGGPYVSMPIAAAFLKSGASVGTMVAFMTGWSLWGINRLPLEIGILGWRFALIRFVSVIIFPPLAGLIAQVVVKVL